MGRSIPWAGDHGYNMKSPRLASQHEIGTQRLHSPHPSRNRRLIRISFVIPTLDQSGAERQMTLLARELAERGFMPSVIALNRGGFYEDALRTAGIRVDILQKRFRFDPLTYLRLRRTLKEQKPDLIHSFLFSANSYVRLPGVSPKGTKVVVSERCVDSWKSGWQLSTDRRLSQKMAAMTVNSQSVADFYSEKAGIPQQQIRVIPNAVTFDSFQDEQPSKPADAVDLRRQFGLSSDAKLVGFIGRLAPQKCLHDLVWAFQLLHQAVDNVFLILAGNGPERDRLAELATSFGCRDKVFFTGHWANSESFLTQLNTFCLPSAFEGMSNSLMEAMLAGVPVVVSDIPANLELVTHEETGLVFPHSDCPEMAKRLKRLLTDDQLSSDLSAAARQKMESEFGLTAMVDRHVELYRSLCGTTTAESHSENTGS